MSGGALVDSQTVTILAERLRRPLPGIDAQRAMAPRGRLDAGYDPEPIGARQAAVLVLMTAAGELVFIRRTHDGRAHSGQIAFPGGAWEIHDADLAQTALRETQEEIGLDPAAITILGKLTPLYVSVSNFTVHPFVGFASDPGPFVCQPSEVDGVLTAPVADLAASAGTMFVARQGRRRRVPCYRCRTDRIWGATAMITAEFLAVWRACVG